MLGLISEAGALRAATFDVDPNEADSADGLPPYSLRDAILAANATPGEDMINLPTGTYELTLGPAVPSRSDAIPSIPESGDLDITEALVINGAGAFVTFVDGKSLDRVFDVHGVSLTIRDVTIRNGTPSPAQIPNEGGGILLRNSTSDGGPAAGKSLTIENCLLTGNHSRFSGGAIGVRSVAGMERNTLNVSGTAFEENEALQGGGAISLFGSDGVISSCSFLSNIAGVTGGFGFGGGAIVSAGGTVTLTNTTFESNSSALDGGALNHHSGSLVLNGASFNSNSAARNGGGIARTPDDAAADIQVSGCNFEGNRADADGLTVGTGGALFNAGFGGASSLNVRFTRLYGNQGAAGGGIFNEGATATALAENNWWGSNAAPADPETIANDGGSASIDADPWLILRFSATPTDILSRDGVNLTADLNGNSDGFVPGGIPPEFVADTTPVAGWGGVLGTSVGASHFTSGLALGVFTAGNFGGTGKATVTVDGETAESGAIAITARRPTISPQPISQTVDPGTTVTFTIGVMGTDPITYQWQQDYVDIPGATTATLTLGSVTEAAQGVYRCVVTDFDAEVSSELASLDINDPAAITSGPASQSVNCGQKVVISVAGFGTEPVTYQWFKDAVSLGGETSPQLTIAHASAAVHAGYYVCRISNYLGQMDSPPAMLSVHGCDADPAESNDALFTGHDLPTLLLPGKSATVQVVVRNTSQLSWSTAQQYSLGLARNDSNIFDWDSIAPNGSFRDPLEVIPGPGGEYIFRGVLHAPKASGSYTVQFQMTQNGADFFGPVLEVVIEVPNAAPGWELYR